MSVPKWGLCFCMASCLVSILVRDAFSQDLYGDVFVRSIKLIDKSSFNSPNWIFGRSRNFKYLKCTNMDERARFVFDYMGWLNDKRHSLLKRAFTNQQGNPEYSNEEITSNKDITARARWEQNKISSGEFWILQMVPALERRKFAHTWWLTNSLNFRSTNSKSREDWISDCLLDATELLYRFTAFSPAPNLSESEVAGYRYAAHLLELQLIEGKLKNLPGSIKPIQPPQLPTLPAANSA